MADRMGQGKMDWDIPVKDRKDEIGILARAFHRLVIRLNPALSRQRYACSPPFSHGAPNAP